MNCFMEPVGLVSAALRATELPPAGLRLRIRRLFVRVRDSEVQGG